MRLEVEVEERAERKEGEGRSVLDLAFSLAEGEIKTFSRNARPLGLREEKARRCSCGWSSTRTPPSLARRPSACAASRRRWVSMVASGLCVSTKDCVRPHARYR